MKVCLTKGCVDEISFVNDDFQNEKSKNLQNSNIVNDNEKFLEKKLNQMKELVDGCGGVICVDKNGKISNFFTTPNMCYASLSSEDFDDEFVMDEEIPVVDLSFNGFCGVEKNEKRRFSHFHSTNKSAYFQIK